MPVRTLRRGTIVRIRDERWFVCGHEQYPDAIVVDVRGCDRTNRGRRTRFLLPCEQLQQLPASEATRVVTRRRWRHLARRTLAGVTPAWDSLRMLTSARIDLLAFQLEPALAVLRGVAARILLADEVGLGKTVQAGLIVAEMLARVPRARVLVACPASLRRQWARELETRFGLQPVLFDSTTLGYPGAHQLSGRNPWSAHPLILASIDYLKRPEVLRALEDLVWDAVVIDEAHGVAGRSDRHAAAVVLGERARTLIMLTATPHSGDDESFRRLCSLGDVNRQFPLAVFRRTRADVGSESSRRTRWFAVKPTAAELDMHRALMDYADRVWRHHGQATSRARLAIIVLLKRACSSAAALARSVERRLHLLVDGDAPFQLGLPFGGSAFDDDEPACELAAPGLADPQVERALLENVLRLARAAQHDESKLRLLRRLLRRTEERALVFTEYRDTLASLADGLASFGCAQLHGGLTAAERDRVLDEFGTGSTRVLLATDAASEGLNLQQRCRLVINLEVPWSPSRLEQRVGRVDRIGQREPVHQLILVADDTEERSTIARMVRDRAARAGQALRAMRRPAVEDGAIADRIFGTGSTRDEDRSAGPDDDDLLVVDLRDRAEEEASRATFNRALGEGDGRDVPIRPFATAFGSRASRGLWAFRLELLDANELLLWETMIGFAWAARQTRFHEAGQVLRHLDPYREAVAADVRRHHEALVSRVASAMRAQTGLARAREEAIITGLERRHARLAASLLQPALFGRRHVDRDTAAQRAVVQEALKRCRQRLAFLERHHPVAGSAAPAFAVIAR